MLKKISASLVVLITAFSILFVSIMRTASIKYDFMPVASGGNVLGDSTDHINYDLPYSGRVQPDSFLWPIKAVRDKIWYVITTDKLRKTELKLLFADKRVGSAQYLFEKGNPELGYSVLTKAEKYLEEAFANEEKNKLEGLDTSEVLLKINTSSLKHYETMNNLLEVAPEDARPKIIETQEYAIRVYENSRDALYEKGIEPCENPFNWQ